MQKQKHYLNTKKVEERKFYYIDFGSEAHGRTSFRLWVHYNFVKWEIYKDKKQKPYIEFPLSNARLQQGKKETTLILRQGKNTIYNIYVPCGYRGSGYAEAFNPKPARKFVYCIYHSPRGNLGIGEGYLVEIEEKNPITFRWKKTGRLYGKPSTGTMIIYPEGKQEELEETDLCEIEDLGEEE